MGHVLKTWTFTGDAEHMGDNAESAASVFAYGANDVRFTATVPGSSTATESGIGDFTERWYDWGVPVNATITHLQITAFSKKVFTTTNVSAHYLEYMDVMTDASTAMTATHLIGTRSWSTTETDTDYEVQVGGSKTAVSVTSLYTDYIALKIHHIVLAGLSAASSVVGYDDITLDIYYEGSTDTATIDVDDCEHAHTCESVTLSADTTVTIASCVHAHTCTNVTPTATSDIAIADCSHAHTCLACDVTTVFTVTPADCAHAVTDTGGTTVEVVQRTATPDDHVSSMPVSGARLVGTQAGRISVVG